MKRTMTAFGVAAAACLALSLGVQAQSTAGSQSGSSAGSAYPQSDKDAKTLRLTGCLQADPSGSGYILSNVTESSSMSSSSAGETSGSAATSGTGTSGSSSSAAAAGETKRVELVAGSSVDLKNHVGERIEVTGTAQGRSKILDPSSSSSETSSSGSGTSGSGQSGTAGSMSSSSSSMGDWNGQKIKVQSVRQVASSCSSQ
jgi:hypothetical protein